MPTDFLPSVGLQWVLSHQPKSTTDWRWKKSFKKRDTGVGARSQSEKLAASSASGIEQWLFRVYAVQPNSRAGCRAVAGTKACLGGWTYRAEYHDIDEIAYLKSTIGYPGSRDLLPSETAPRGIIVIAYLSPHGSMPCQNSPPTNIHRDDGSTHSSWANWAPR